MHSTAQPAAAARSQARRPIHHRVGRAARGRPNASCTTEQNDAIMAARIKTGTATIFNMQCLFMRHLGAAFFICAAGLAQADDSASSEEAGHWRLVVSPYTHHFRYSAEHQPVWALGLERQLDERWLLGATYFSNSFGQPSGFVYTGHRYENVFGQPSLFAQWSAGILYGYKGKYQNKVPLNFNGYSPGVLLTAGWRSNSQSSVALHLLGDAAVMLQVAWDFR